MAREFAEVSYTLRDLYVAAYNRNANTYGTPARVEGGQLLVSDPESDTDKLRAYGQIERGLAVVIGAKVQLKAGGVDFSALAILAGLTNAVSGSTPNQVRTSKVGAGGSGLPYFGALGVAAVDDGGVAVIGLPCVKLDTFPKWTMDGEQNRYNISDVAGYAFPIGGYLETIKTYETLQDWAAPDDGAEFLAFFS